MSTLKKGKITFSEKAYRTIKHLILRGDIPEGTFLSQAEISKRYGIGRTPLREACSRLHQQQLVELVPRRGFLVRGISFRDVVDLFELRLVLEVSSAELAVVRGTAAEIESLGDQASELLSEGASTEDLIDANTRFHLSLAKMSRNAEITKALAHLLERYEALSYAETRNNQLTPQSLKDLHGPIVEALRVRNSAGVRAAICRDILETQQMILPHELPAYTTAAVVEILKGSSTTGR